VHVSKTKFKNVITDLKKVPVFKILETDAGKHPLYSLSRCSGYRCIVCNELLTSFDFPKLLKPAAAIL
jgi:hypothetical protein